MTNYYADLHIHIGRTYTGKPVKITAARNLTLINILAAARFPKGLDIVGVIDSHSPEVIEEIEQLIVSGSLVELAGGGFRYEEEVTLIPGVEIEVYDQHCQGPIHVLAYFPTLRSLKEFSLWLSKRVTNIQLSTQRMYEDAQVLQQEVKSLGGLFIPAHVFTPFKSLYGKGVKRSMTEVLEPHLIDGIELGLSSDTKMADQIAELHHFTFVSNSDAHSLPKIAREYQTLKLKEPSFQSIEKALAGQDNHGVVANYGLDPYLGKYYRTTCSNCFTPKKGSTCPHCGLNKFTKGVSERINELSSNDKPPIRPSYVHQVPLEFLPGLGPKTLERLYNHFGTEMNILHQVAEEDLANVVNHTLANLIVRARSGLLQLEQGGGGKYGRVR